MRRINPDQLNGRDGKGSPPQADSQSVPTSRPWSKSPAASLSNKVTPSKVIENWDTPSMVRIGSPGEVVVSIFTSPARSPVAAPSATQRVARASGAWP